MFCFSLSHVALSSGCFQHCAEIRQVILSCPIRLSQADYIGPITAAARLPARTDPLNSELERPRSVGARARHLASSCSDACTTPSARNSVPKCRPGRARAA